MVHMAHPNGRGCVAVATATDVGAADEKSEYGSCLIFNVGESRYRSKKTSVPGFFFAANGGDVCKRYHYA